MKPFNKEKAPQVELKIGDVVVHGDVLVQKIKELPEGFSSYKKCDDNAVAYGEATGHVHLLDEGVVDVRQDPSNMMNRFIEIAETAVLKHQEHKQVTLPPGIYKSWPQEEYDPFTKKLRQVAD